MMTRVRGWMTACLMAVWLAVCPGAGAVAHPASAAPDNGMGSCAALGSSVGEAVWSWCYKNERDNLNGCKASFRSWVREVERTCAQRRREFGCSPSDHTAVEWHVHGWKQPGRELSLHRAVQYCDDDKQGRTAGPGPGDAPPALDRETRVRVQRALAAQGFDAGQADGSFGPRTRGAIRAWQQAKGHATTGELTGGQVERLLADSPAGSGAATGDLYGSIAFSQLDGGGYAFGIAWNALGREAARRSAVEECGRRGGGGGCSEAGWFRNACGAIAIGDANGYGTGWGENTGEAESSALSRCRSANANCRVAMSRCVDGQYNEHETEVAAFVEKKEHQQHKEAKQVTETDAEAFTRARSINSPQAYNAYLSSWCPEGKFCLVARRQVDDIIRDRISGKAFSGPLLNGHLKLEFFSSGMFKIHLLGGAIPSGTWRVAEGIVLMHYSEFFGMYRVDGEATLEDNTLIGHFNWKDGTKSWRLTELY